MLSDADVSGLTKATDSPGCITLERAEVGEDGVHKHQSNKWLLQM